MKIYDVSDIPQSIVHHTWRMVDADLTSYPLNDVIRQINADYEELVSLIINSDGTHEWDDTNHTNHPRSRGLLVEGQEDYSITANYLQIEAVDVLDVNGTYRRLRPLDHKELDGYSPEEYFGLTSAGNPLTGMPRYYDKNGDTIRLYPSPTATQVTLANGLRMWFKRTADLFTTSDTTQAPGLPSTHHVLLAYMAAIPYAMSYKPTRVAWLENKVEKMKQTLIEHYAQREKDKSYRVKSHIKTFR